MSDTTLVIGMPAGSLADPRRGGNLVTLLKQAGFPSHGYDEGGPTTFPISAFLMGWDGRPQEFGSQLALGEIDIAIGGNDWIRERQLEMKYEYGQDFDIVKVLPLGRGNVRIVVIKRPGDELDCDAWLKSLLAQKPVVTVVSEMPYLALEWFQKKAKALGFGESHGAYSVQKYRTPPRIDGGLVIYETWGKTEAKVKNGAVDFGVEITQSGSAIRNYGLAITDEIMHSEASVWANPALKKDPEKYGLARMFLLNMYGAIFAEDKVLLMFNVKKGDVKSAVKYLEENRLFSDEPTMNEGVNFVEFSIQLDARSKDLPLPKVRYDLAMLGATGIETVPLESSIPGIDAIDF